MAQKRLVLENFLPYRLSYTSNLVSEAVADTYKTLFGLTIPEWRVVAHIAENADITQQDICARSKMDKVTVSRAAIALQDRKLIDRKPNPSDRRSQILVLTGQGQSLYRAVAPKAIELETKIFGRFSSEEIKTFIAMLRSIDAAAGKLAVSNASPKIIAEK